jgi:large repetitive protein
VTSQRPIPNNDARRGATSRWLRQASHSRRFARLGMALIMLTVFLVGAPLMRVPVALAASGFNVSSISGNTTEAGGTATFTIKLTGAPSSNVTIALTSSNTNEGIITSPNPASLTFTPSNWNNNQTVIVKGVDDAIDDGNVTYSIITAPAVSSDGSYNGKDPSDVSVINTDNDTAGITVSAISAHTTETGGTATFTVVLATQPADDVTIGLSSNDLSEGTVSPASLTFTSANWSTPQLVTVTGVDDFVDDGDITYSIVTAAATSSDSNYSGRNANDVTVVNDDNDTAGVTLTSITGNTSEVGGTATFTVKLNSQPTADVTIGLSSNDLSEGTVSPASLLFDSTNWNTAQTVTVTGVDDAIADGNITYSILTANASSSDTKYNNMVIPDVSVVNTDNDGVGFIVSNISDNTTEAGGTAIFTVKLTSQPSQNVVIPVSSSDTTEGTVSVASLTFTSANWNQNQTVTVSGVNDNVDDGDIGYTIVLGNATGGDPQYNNLNPADVPIVNIDDDTVGINVSSISGNTTEAGGTATFTVVLGSQPTSDVSIALISEDLNEGTVSPSVVTFTPANWNQPQTVTVSGVDDFLADGDIIYTIVTDPAISSDPLYNDLNAPDVNVVNIDNDLVGITVSPIGGSTTETGGTATFTIQLTSQPYADVVIALSSSDTTEGTVSPASLTLNASNWNTAQTVTVSGVNDDVDDGDVSYTIVTAPISSLDEDYNGQDAADVTVTNVDDDTAGVTVSAISGNTSEAGGTATFTVKLNSQPTADVTIGLSSSDTAEGTVSPASLTFTSANWSAEQTVTVTGVDDAIDDGDMAYAIVTGAASSLDLVYNGLAVDDVSLSNIDNDGAGVLVSAISGDTTEVGGTATFTVKLTSQPLANVNIALSSSDTTEGTVSPTSLTFTSLNWNTAQTVTVSGVNDDVDDGDIGYDIVLAAATSTDATYNGQDAADIPVVNIDDDTAGFTMSPISGNTSETGVLATFMIKLTSQPTADVTIGLSSSNTSEGTVSPASLTFTALNWNIARTVTVSGANDDVDDGDVAYSVVTDAAASADPNYNLLNADDVSLSNIDDDTAGVTVSAISGNTSEASGTATFTVKLNSQPLGDVSISLSSGDLTEGTVAPTLLSFNGTHWNTPQLVTVTGADDFIDDGDITYTIVTGPASSSDPGYNGMVVADVTVVNTDDDGAGVIVAAVSGSTTEAGGTATFTVKLNSQPTADVAIGLSSSDTTEGTVSPASLTFTALDWTIPQTVTVSGVNDDMDDGDIAYNIVLAPATSADPGYNGQNAADVPLVNIDDDTAGFTVSAISGNTTEAGGTATFTVKLTSQPTADVTIGLSSSDTTEGTVSPASLTFTSANWNVEQAVTASGVDDAIDDGDVGYAIVTDAATSADLVYNGQNAADASLANVDDDGAGVVVSAISGNTTEAGGTATFTVKLNSQPTADVTIGLSSSDTTEGTVSPASLTFTSANWNTPQTVTVTGVDDVIDDGDISYDVVLAATTSADPVYNGQDAADVPVVNQDNDGAGVVVSAISGNTTEAGGTATFTVKLNSQPTADVAIGLSSSDTTEGTVSPASLTFTPANWNTPQTVTVSGVDDSVADGNVSYTIVTSTATSADPAYNGQSAVDVTVLNIDNDPASGGDGFKIYLPLVRQ